MLSNHQSAGYVPPASHAAAWAACGVVWLATLPGCGGAAHKYDATVTGNVLIEGQLVDRGTVTFHPVKGGAPAIGQVRPDGSFSIRMGQGNLKEADGGTVPSGEYLITIVVTGEPVPVPDLPDSPPKGGPRLMADKYARVDTTDLRRKVEPGPNLFQFDLERAAPVKPTEEQPADAKDGAKAPAPGDQNKADESRATEAAPSANEAKPAVEPSTKDTGGHTS